LFGAGLSRQEIRRQTQGAGTPRSVTGDGPPAITELTTCAVQHRADGCSVNWIPVDGLVRLGALLFQQTSLSFVDTGQNRSFAAVNLIHTDGQIALFLTIGLLEGVGDA